MQGWYITYHPQGKAAANSSKNKKKQSNSAFLDYIWKSYISKQCQTMEIHHLIVGTFESSLGVKK